MHSHAERGNEAHQRRGFSLLEVLLALGLTTVVLALVGAAVNSTLRTVESGRKHTEREQLARAIMHRIAADLRAVVRYEPFDESGMTSVSGSGLGSPSGSGGNLGGASDGSGGSSSSADAASQTDGQSETGDASATTIATSMPGLYGYQDRLQVDISRIPRLDEYLYADGVTAMLPRGDVRTVSYFLAGSLYGAAPVGTTPAAMGGADSAAATGGLARSELDRATALWLSQQGDAAALDQNAIILAPEVASLEFRYFDGIEWLTEWDSTVYGGLPRAVEISIYLIDEINSGSAADSASAGGYYNAAMTNPDNIYRLVVHLPAGLPLQTAGMATAETDTTQQDSSSDSGSSGTSQTGGQP